MKKILLSLFLLLSVSLIAGCSDKEDKTGAVALGEITINSDADGNISLSLENDDIRAKYDELYATFEGVNLDKIIAGTTSTANMLYEIGITPLGAPSSTSLNSELTEMQCEAEIVSGCTVGNIGSAIAPSQEVIIALESDILIISDALFGMYSEDKITELYGNTTVTAFPQSEVADMFVILQVLQDVDSSKTAGIQPVFQDMYQDIQDALQLVEESALNNPSATIVQGSTTNYTVKEETVVGTLVAGLSITNPFATTGGELNSENFIAQNTDFIIVYSHNSTAGAEAFVELLEDTSGLFRTMSAVTNENYFILETTFSGSVDLNITKILLEIAQGIYS